MAIQLLPLGGYGEIGRNCTAIRVDDEVIIIDLGLNMQKYVELTEDEEVKLISSYELAKTGVIPDLELLKNWKDKIIAIIPTHAHLDHIGAIPFLANKLKGPVICTPFTKEVLKRILKDEDKRLKKPIIELRPGKSMKLSDKITIEFIPVTHSTPHTIFCTIHTKYGSIVYSNDFKIDQKPLLGQSIDLKRIKALGKSGKVILFIADSLYADITSTTPSESVVEELLEDAYLSLKDAGIIIFTTFASHIARIKTILNLANKKNRKILILGRSMHKYLSAAHALNLIHIPEHVRIIRYKKEMLKILKKVHLDREKYILITTGHQAEPGSVLSGLANKNINFEFKPNDAVIFSSKIIPVEYNILNRKKLDNLLKSQGVRIFTDMHVSGHASREDLREIISMLKPKIMIPSHSTIDKAEHFIELAEQMGYKRNKNIFIINNGLIFNLPIKH